MGKHAIFSIVAILSWLGSFAQSPNYQLLYRTRISWLQITNTVPMSSWDSIYVKGPNGWMGTAPRTVWDNLPGKPAAYPSTIALIPTLQTVLDAKANQSALAGYQPVGNYLTSINASQVTTALGYTPYNSSNPNNYISASGAPVQSVNGQTGAVSLTIPVLNNASVTAALGYTPYNANNPSGYVTATTSPVRSVNGQTGEVNISIPSQVQADWSENATTSAAFIKNKPSIPVLSNASIVSALGYTPYNSTNPNNYISASGAPVQSVNGQTGAVSITVPVLNNANIVAGLGYTPYNGATNPNGYITSAPVSSVNGKTGAVIVTKADVGLANIPFSKVRYYTVTSDASSVWTVNLGSEFTSITDVQVQASSVANTVAGIRQVSLNSWTSTSTTLSGVTYGSNTIATVLISAVQSLALIPSTTVRIVVYGN